MLAHIVVVLSSLFYHVVPPVLTVLLGFAWWLSSEHPLVSDAPKVYQTLSLKFASSSPNWAVEGNK